MASETTQSTVGVETDFEKSSEDDRQYIPVLRDGVYLVTNKRSRTQLDLAAGDPTPGTHVVGWEWNPLTPHENQRWILKYNEAVNSYTIQNLRGGTFLHLSEGGVNGTRVVCWPRIEADEAKISQEWYINEVEPLFYTIQSSRTQSFLEIANGSTNNLAAVQCSKLQKDHEHQTWRLELASSTSAEILGLLSAWKPDIASCIFRSYRDSTKYIILSSPQLMQIWKETGLQQQLFRPDLFEHGDFVTKFKDAVKDWARKLYSTEVHGYSIMCGSIYGDAQKGPKAYNWCLTYDRCTLLFIDPQIGREYSSTALDSFGFEPKLVVF